ncbi:MAG: hypothetical protein ACRDPV_05865 [Gaiellaceae bacterium]
METWEWIALAVAVGVILLVIAVFAGSRSRRTSRLQERFGPEYDRAVSASGQRDAERRLSEVDKKHDELDIRPLPAAAQERYLEEWRNAEIRFVSDPRDAARAAERVVVRVLEERGYPLDTNTDEQAALVAVDHPDVVERYRHGHAMLENVDGPGSTENLRKAMIDFRTVLDELLEGRRTAVA